MAPRDISILAALAAVGVLVYFYSDSAGASVSEQFADQSGDGGWWDESTGSVNDGSATDLGTPWGIDIFSSDSPTPPSSDLDSESNPGIDFGIVDSIKGAFVGWKSGDYPKYASAIRDAESRYGIPQDLLGRLLYQESHFRPDVIAGYKRSPVGALGIAQFMPATARDMGLQLVASSYNGTATQTYDPFASIDAAGRYLKSLYSQLNDWKNALVAYNWGIGNVKHWLHGDTRIVNGQEVHYAPPDESRQYVAQITADVQVA